MPVSVAPLAGAWIEIVVRRGSPVVDIDVAPLAGAWIEICAHPLACNREICRSPCESVD